MDLLDVLRRGSLFRVKFSIWPAEVKYDSKSSETVKKSKVLLDKKKAYKFFHDLANETRALKEYKTLPFDEGLRFTPEGVEEEVRAEIKDLGERFEEAMNVFLEEYPLHCEEQQQKLDAEGISYDGNYPQCPEGAGYVLQDWESGQYKFDDIRSKFGMSYYFIVLEYKGTHEEIQRKIDQTKNILEGALVTRFKEMLDHMIERLTSEEDGQKKIFRDSLLGNLNRFFEDFDKLNVTNNTELEKVVNKARTIMGGVDLIQLRTTEDIRDVVRDRMSEVQRAVDTMIVNMPGRSVTILEESKNEY